MVASSKRFSSSLRNVRRSSLSNEGEELPTEEGGALSTKFCVKLDNSR